MKDTLYSSVLESDLQHLQEWEREQLVDVNVEKTQFVLSDCLHNWCMKNHLLRCLDCLS